MLFNFFHKHTWSTPHHAEGSNQQSGNYVMRCYECGAEREVQAPLQGSSEIERRIVEAREKLQKLNRVS